MARSSALAALSTAGAEDMVRQKIYSKYTVYVPTGNAEIDNREALESIRETDIPYSDKNLAKYWYLFPVGRFELEFEDSILTSINCWQGTENESVEYLVLENHWK